MNPLKILIILIFVVNHTFAQVGINTTDPKATLDVKATDPANPTSTEGLLIPRVTALNLSATVDQDHMMVMLTQPWTDPVTSRSYNQGFHRWDSTVGASGDWIPIIDIKEDSLKKTRSISNYTNATIEGASLMTFSCFQAKLKANGGNKLDLQIYLNCNDDDECHFSYTYNTTDLATPTNGRSYFDINQNNWLTIKTIDVGKDEMVFGYLYLPVTLKLYKIVISTNKNGANKKVTYTIHEQ